MSARAAATLAFLWTDVTRLVGNLLRDGFHGEYLLARDGVTLALSCAVARFAFSARSRAAMTGRMALGTVLLSGVWLAFAAIHNYSHYLGNPDVVTGPLVLGQIFTLALSTAYAALLPRLVGRHIETPSSENADRARAVAGAWVLLSQAPAVLWVLGALALQLDGTELREALGAPSWAHTLFVTGVLNIAFPVAFVISARLRIRARRRWLESVRAGALPNWRLVERIPPTGEAAGLPHLTRVADGDNPHARSRARRGAAVPRKRDPRADRARLDRHDDAQREHEDAVRNLAGLCLVSVMSAACGAKAGASADGGMDSTSGNTPGAPIGAPCLLSPEQSASFPGFSEQDLNTGPEDPDCASRFCLVNHFRGRTNCPYGQDSNGKGPDGYPGCTVPGEDAAVRPNDPVEGQTVRAQCTDRKAADTVYCSCRCANLQGGTDDAGTYCSCPSGMTCTQLVAPVGSAFANLAGAYCIKTGTQYDPNRACVSCSPQTAPCP
jgi:hypothetical protein